MKFFYIFAALWLIALFLGDAPNETYGHVTGIAIVFLFLLVLAVYGLSQRIDRAVKQVKDPSFDMKAAEWQDWFEVGKVFLVVVAMLVVVTAVQGFVRCVNSSDDEVSLACAWDGFW